MSLWRRLLTGRVRAYQWVGVLLCCCGVARGHVGIAAVPPAAPVSEAESEQAPAEAVPEEGEAAWATPRGRDARPPEPHFARLGAADSGGPATVVPAGLAPCGAPRGGCEHALRYGLGAPLRV